MGNHNEATAEAAVGESESESDENDPESVGENHFIIPSSKILQCYYYFTLPMKLSIYLTIPDVRKIGYEQYAILATCIGFIWLGLLTYGLVTILSILAYLLGINASVMGLTIGAWATSYPAVWSSVIVARDGYGDMAICNALGSIVFSNYLGLGLPWIVYMIVYQETAYDKLQNQGVVLSIVILLLLLIASYIMIAMNQFVLKRW